jgi:hypothetical protein
MNELYELDLSGVPFVEGYHSLAMLLRFSFNMLMVWMMVHFLYYPESRRRDSCVTSMLISISIFFMICLLGGVRLEVGFALGLFAIFGIIRYRTVSMPVREKTCLFCIIAMSVINVPVTTISCIGLIAADMIFIIATWLFESYVLLRHVSTKLIQYDRMALITPERYGDMLTDMKPRTGMNIAKADVRATDFLGDMATLKIYYESGVYEDNSTINNELKLSA